MSRTRASKPATEVPGAAYVARVQLSSKPGPGFQIFAEPGETCERVPAKSLEWLVEQQLIVPKAPPAPSATAEAEP